MPKTSNLKFLLLAAAFHLASAGSTAASPVPSSAITLQKPGWTLVFDDEFNGGRLDRSKWIDSFPNGARVHGAPNVELPYYSPDAVTVDRNGLHLTATARPQGGRLYTSGVVSTYQKFFQTYGLWEISARLPGGHGMWPAFWLKNESGHWPPEIDILELLGAKVGQLLMTLHWANPFTNADQYSSVAATDKRWDHEWHTYAIDWEPNGITWYVDGQAERVMTDHIPQTPMFLILNLTVDGRPYNRVDSTTLFPQVTDIDYVRIYKRSR